MVHFVSAADHDPNAEPLPTPATYQPSAAVLQMQIKQMQRQIDRLTARIDEIEQQRREEQHRWQFQAQRP